MDRDLLGYLPKIVENCKEIKLLLQSERAQFELTALAMNNILSNTFIFDCDLKGIIHYEEMLSAVSDKSKSLEERRQIVLNRWNRKLPYTVHVLEDLISGTVGKENVRIILDGYNLKVAVKEQSSIILKELNNTVYDMIPANLAFMMVAEYADEVHLDIKISTSFTALSSFYPRFNVPVLTYNRFVKYDGKYKYNGLLTDKTIRFYSEKMNISSSKELNFTLNECLKLYNHYKNEVFLNSKMNLKSNFRQSIQIEDRLLFYSNANQKAEIIESLHMKSAYKITFLIDSKFNLKCFYKPKIHVENRLNIITSKAIVPAYETKLTIVHHPNRYDGKYKYNGIRKYNTRVEMEKL